MEDAVGAPGNIIVSGSTGDVFTIAAPPAPSYIEVTDLQLFASGVSTVTIKSGSEEIDKATLGVGNSYNRGGQRTPPLRCNPGEALTINNSAGTLTGGGTYHVVTVATKPNPFV